MSILVIFHVQYMGSTRIPDLWHYRQDAVICVFQTHGQSTTKSCTHRAEKTPLAEMTLPGKFTLVVTVSSLLTSLILVISSSISALK